MRELYLVAYDIASPRRLHRVLQAVKASAAGGQKSVFECFLSRAEARLLVSELRGILDDAEDSAFVLKLGRNAAWIMLGIAVAPADPLFFYQG